MIPVNNKVEDLLNQARKYRSEGKYFNIRALLDRADRLCANDDYLSHGRIFTFHAQIARDRHELDYALEWYNKALKLFQKIGEIGKIAHTIRHIADIESELGRTRQAEENYLRALEMYKLNKRTPDLDLANAHRGFAILLDNTGNKAKAKEIWTEARDLYMKANIQAGVEECEEHLK